METSELYKMNDQYYLTVLADVEDHPSLYPAWLLAVCGILQMIWYQPVQFGQVIINHDAVQGLQSLKYLKKTEK